MGVRVQGIVGWLTKQSRARARSTCVGVAVLLLVLPPIMPKPYAIDFRWRIVWLSTAKGQNPEEISALVCVSRSTIRRYLTLFERTGYARLENPGIFLDELKDKLSGRFGVTVHTSAICRALQFIGCTRQVIKHSCSA